MLKSKFFRVAVEGATATDGRQITAAWIDEMVGNFNPQTYGVRVNMEHIRGFSPEPPFNAYGDVTGLKAQDDEIEIGGKTEKRRAMYAEINPTDELVKLTKARQKIYTSIEVAPNFANTGKAGLVGLAATDSPASLGTDMLAFSAPSANNPAVKAFYDSRKLAPENALSAALETKIEFVAQGEDAGDKQWSGFFTELKKFMNPGGQAAVTDGGGKSSPGTDPALTQSPPQGQGGQSAPQFSSGAEALIIALGAQVETGMSKFDAEMIKLRGEFTDLKTKLETTESLSSKRPPSTGGTGAVLAEY